MNFNLVVSECPYLISLSFNLPEAEAYLARLNIENIYVNGSNKDLARATKNAYLIFLLAYRESIKNILSLGFWEPYPIGSLENMRIYITRFPNLSSITIYLSSSVLTISEEDKMYLTSECRNLQQLCRSCRISKYVTSSRPSFLKIKNKLHL